MKFENIFKISILIVIICVRIIILIRKIINKTLKINLLFLTNKILVNLFFSFDKLEIIIKKNELCCKSILFVKESPPQ